MPFYFNNIGRIVLPEYLNSTDDGTGAFSTFSSSKLPTTRRVDISLVSLFLLHSSTVISRHACCLCILIFGDLTPLLIYCTDPTTGNSEHISKKNVVENLPTTATGDSIFIAKNDGFRLESMAMDEKE